MSWGTGKGKAGKGEKPPEMGNNWDWKWDGLGKALLATGAWLGGKG